MTYDYTEPNPDQPTALLWVVPAGDHPQACTYPEFYFAAGDSNEYLSIFPLPGSPAEFSSGDTFAGHPIALVPGQAYAVCVMADNSTGVGSPVVGTATPTAPAGGGGTATPIRTFTLTSSPVVRSDCWPTVSGLGGTWVQLTDSGCVPPKSGATLLGWATSPDFPVARATNGVVVDEDFNGVRMIFIPINGYTLLSSDNTLYPIWSA